MQRKFFNLSLVVLIGLGFALAQQSATQSVPNVDRLRRHIEYLASDKLEGRRTATPGANLAAEYIAREFSRLGLRRTNGRDLPGMSRLEAESPTRYYQQFPYVAEVQLGSNNSFTVKTLRGADSMQFKVRDDWLPLGFSSNADLSGAEAAFAGYGMSSQELKYDDYAISSVKDRIAIVFAGTPDGDNPHGQFGQAGQVRFKVAAARAAGARALLIISNEEKITDDRLARLSYDNAGEAGLPVLVISRPMAAKLLTLVTLSEYQQAADARKVEPVGLLQANDSKLTVNKGEVLRAPMGFRAFDISVDVVRRQVPAHNVIGILEGTDPKLKNEAIVVGAHYDHLGHGGAGSLAHREGEIHHGADDNASGVAGMLELARTLSAERPRRTIVFAAFGGEEEGLLGSNYYVNHPIVPIANTVAMINLDMIGRATAKRLIVGGVGTSPEWKALLENANLGSTPHEIGKIGGPNASAARAVIGNGQPAAGDDRKPEFELTLNEDGFGPSDHSSFYSKQIPVLFFWTGTHADYHKPSDTAEKINYEDEARILGLVEKIVRALDSSATRPAYAVARSSSTGRSSGFRVYLGTIPNYADSSDGLLLDGVRDDSPAANAGLRSGDKIVKLAGREVKNVYDYTAALGEMKADQEYEVELLRLGERITLVIIPAARR